MTQQIQFIGIAPEEQVQSIVNSFKRELQSLKEHFQPKEPTEYISRKETSEMLGVNLSTLHKWTREGKLTSYGLGGRVWYKRHEIEASLTQINF